MGFLEEPDGSLLVAAGSPTTRWAANLLADPACHGTISGVRRAYLAEELSGADRARAISGLILKYGTPAEGLGTGPALRLRPAAPTAADEPAADVARDPDGRAPR